jgi:hypothetical protein
MILEKFLSVFLCEAKSSKVGHQHIKLNPPPPLKPSDFELLNSRPD